jgi:adenosine deaminase
MRLKAYLHASSISVSQAIQLIKIFDKGESKFAVQAGVIICQSLTSPSEENIAEALRAFRYPEESSEVMEQLRSNT